MLDSWLPDFPEDRRTETAFIVDSGGSHRRWEELSSASRASLDRLCQHVEVAIQTRRGLKNVRALQQNHPLHYALLEAIAEAPLSTPDPADMPAPTHPALDANLSAPIVLDPVVAELSDAPSSQHERIWAYHMLWLLSAVSFLAFGALICFIIYCIKGDVQ